MLQNELGWFFRVFDKDFRLNSTEAFQTLIFLALAHFFGFYNPKQLADYLGISSKGLYRRLKSFSLYRFKSVLLKFMVKQAAENLKEVLIIPKTAQRPGSSRFAENPG
jgi:AraC-like DNA-binding protein